MTHYLDSEEILIIHAKIIDATGGAHGVRDMHLLASMAERSRMAFAGKELYPTIFDKAAAYFESAAFHHVFVDGNKRTAIAIAARFLFLNGYELTATNNELEKFVLTAVQEKHELAIVSQWLKRHTEKPKR